MKHTRLLEIIREEIAGALNELTVVDKKTSSAEATEIAKSENSDINTVKDAMIQAKKSGKPVNVAEEKRKKLAEKYQLDEETINEMASVVQTRQALEALEKAGIPNSTERLELVKDVEKETLDQFKNSNPSMTSDGRLARKLEPEEITGKRDTRGYGADFERNFKKKAGMDFLDFTITIQKEIETNKIPLSKEFNAGLATNTTEKEAAAQVFGLEKRTPGPQADPNKPKKEKPASTGKKGRPAGEPKSEKTATLTKGDDGFDTVEYSDVDSGDKEATQNIGSDKTAQKLGKTSSAADKLANLFDTKTTEEAKKKMKELAQKANSGDQKAKAFFDNEENKKIIQAYRKAQKVNA
jgi:hypothetical protein